MANFKIQNVRIQLKHDTATNWAASTLIPLAGELCLDTTNNVIKIGNGTDTFANLSNAGSVITNASAYNATTNPGGIDEEHGGIKVNGTDINVYTLNPASASKLGGIIADTKVAAGSGTVNKIYIDSTSHEAYVEYVSYADQLKTTRTISFAESASNAGDTDVTGTFDFNGSANVSTQLTLVDKFNTGEGQNTKRVVVATVDKKGRVVADEDLVSADVSDAIAETDNTVADNASKVIKTDASGELDNSFLKDVERNDASADNTATAVITGITSDDKGRITATSQMAATDVGAADNADATAKAAVAGKLVKANADGKVADTFLKATGVTANDGANDAPYTAVKVDVKGRVVAGTTAAATIAKNKDTDSTDGHAAQLGFVQSDYDDNLDANADGNKGKVAIDGSGNMTVTRVAEADKFHTARTISAAGTYAQGNDATFSVSFDGSADVESDIVLTDTLTFSAEETTAGHKRVVVSQVDTKGRVIGAESLVSSDVSDAVATKGAAAKVILSDSAGELDDTFLKAVTRTDTDNVNTSTAVVASITTDTKGRVTATSTIDATVTGGTSAASGKLVKLGTDGKLDDSIIPAIALTDTYVVANITARDALTGVQIGDIAVVTDATADSDVPEGGATYIVSAVTPTITWTRLKTPTDVVDSVNGKTGTVVLTTSDIAEGTNLYYTSDRATTDANKVVAGGFYLLDCGGATGEDSATVLAKTFIDPATGANAVPQNQGD